MILHGTASWFVEGRIVIGEAQGPFNYEGILSLRKGMMALSVSYDDKPWAIVCTLSGDSLFTPEAEEEHKILMRELAERNLTGVIYSLASHHAKSVFEYQIRRIYQGSGVSVSIAESLDEAMAVASHSLEG